jgi:hypothetical protein
MSLGSEKGGAARAAPPESTARAATDMSLAEPRYCAMGERCTQARFLGGYRSRFRRLRTAPCSSSPSRSKTIPVLRLNTLDLGGTIAQLEDPRSLPLVAAR